MTAAIPTPAALSPAEHAVAFLKALGKDPAQTYFRTLQRGTPPNMERRGRDLLGFDFEALAHDNASQSVYVVVGNATGATGSDRKTGRPTGAVIDEDCATVSAVFVEWDNKPIDWQRNAWKELRLPEPSLMVATGGKSVHCYWVLREPMPAAEWRQLQRRLIEHCDGDRNCKNPSRVMRLPGFAYIDKATGKPTDNRAEIIHSSGARYSVQELEQCIPAGTAAPAPLQLLQAPRPAPMVSGAQVPFRDFITKAAAELIETGSREGSCNDDGLALSMELVAVEAWLQAQGAQSDEAARDAYACYISHCPDTINGSPFDTRAAWARFEGAADQRPTPGTPEDKLLSRLGFHHRKAAQPASNVIPFSGTRSTPAAEVVSADVFPDIETPSEASGTPARKGALRRDPKPKKLSLIRRMACFDHCVAALVARERNTLRRMVRLRGAIEALGLKGAIRDGEMAEAVMQAIDRRNGNVYSLISGEEMNRISVPVIRWLIPGVIPANDLTILGGRPKVGKNRLAIDAVRAMLRQEDFLGFGIAPTQPDVILVTDDQGDASTKDQLQRHGIFGHPRLHWSRKFRVTVSDLDRLIADVEARPGALVVIDSLRSITRSCRFKENDPEMGALVYDLKNSIIDKGGSLLLIHHCNKSTEATGVEALSGHNAIAGAGSTVLTLHYLSAGKVGSLPMKATPDRRLACESRDTQSFDLVVTLDGGTGRWQRIGPHAEWLAHQGDEKRARKVAELSEEQKAVLEVIGGWSDQKGPTVREIAQAITGEQDPPKPRLSATREKCQAMVRRGFLRPIDRDGITTYQIREIPQET